MGCPSGRFLSRFPTKTLCAFPFSYLHGTCPADLIPGDYTIPKTNIECDYTLWILSLENFPPPCCFPSDLSPYAPVSTLFLNTRSVFCLSFELQYLTPIQNNRQNCGFMYSSLGLSGDHTDDCDLYLLGLSTGSLASPQRHRHWFKRCVAPIWCWSPPCRDSCFSGFSSVNPSKCCDSEQFRPPKHCSKHTSIYVWMCILATCASNGRLAIMSTRCSTAPFTGHFILHTANKALM